MLDRLGITLAASMFALAPLAAAAAETGASAAGTHPEEIIDCADAVAQFEQRFEAEGPGKSGPAGHFVLLKEGAAQLCETGNDLEARAVIDAANTQLDAFVETWAGEVEEAS